MGWEPTGSNLHPKLGSRPGPGIHLRIEQIIRGAQHQSGKLELDQRPFGLDAVPCSSWAPLSAVTCPSPSIPSCDAWYCFGGMQSQLNDVKRYFGADIQRMMQEFEARRQGRGVASVSFSGTPFRRDHALFAAVVEQGCQPSMRSCMTSSARLCN